MNIFIEEFLYRVFIRQKKVFDADGNVDYKGSIMKSIATQISRRQQSFPGMSVCLRIATYARARNGPR